MANMPVKSLPSADSRARVQPPQRGAGHRGDHADLAVAVPVAQVLDDLAGVGLPAYPLSARALHGPRYRLSASEPRSFTEEGAMRMPRTAYTVCLLDADPDLGTLLNAARREQAEREPVVRRHRLPMGPWVLTDIEDGDVGVVLAGDEGGERPNDQRVQSRPPVGGRNRSSCGRKGHRRLGQGQALRAALIQPLVPALERHRVPNGTLASTTPTTISRPWRCDVTGSSKPAKRF
jgi:hypothetical protein